MLNESTEVRVEKQARIRGGVLSILREFNFDDEDCLYLIGVLASCLPIEYKIRLKKYINEHLVDECGAGG